MITHLVGIHNSVEGGAKAYRAVCEDCAFRAKLRRSYGAADEDRARHNGAVELERRRQAKAARAIEPIPHVAGEAPVAHPDSEARPFVLEASPLYCGTGRPLRVHVRPATVRQ